MSPHAPPLNLEENDDFGEGAAHSTAFETAKGTLDPELAPVIDAWHWLSPDTRTAILAIVNGVKQGKLLRPSSADLRSEVTPRVRRPSDTTDLGRDTPHPHET